MFDRITLVHKQDSDASKKAARISQLESALVSRNQEINSLWARNDELSEILKVILGSLFLSECDRKIYAREIDVRIQHRGDTVWGLMREAANKNAEREFEKRKALLPVAESVG